MINFFATLVTLGFVLGNFGRIRIYESITFSLLDISIVICILAFWIGRRGRDLKINKKILFSFGIFVLFCFISLLINAFSYTQQQILVAFLYLVRWFMYAQIFFIVLSLKQTEKKVIENFLFISGASVVVIGFIQYFFYPNLRNLYYLGWDDHLYRMFSTFLDPNFAGIVFALIFLFSFGRFLDVLKKKLNYSLLIFSIATLLAVFLTYSRTALIMLFVSICSLLWMQGYKKFIPILVIVLFTIVFFISNTRIEGTNPFRIASSEARVISVKEALAVFVKHPIFGVGFNAYRYALEQAGFRTKDKIVPSNADAGADTSLLFILATTGIVGFASYVYLWKNILSFVIQRAQNPHRAIVLSSILGLFVSSLFINSLFYPFILLWMWVILGLTENN